MFCGELLKGRREGTGLTREERGRRVFVPGAQIGLFEQGIRKPQLDLAMRIGEVLQTGGIFERTCRELIDKSPFASYSHEAAEPETVATEIRAFAPRVVPGLSSTAFPASARSAASGRPKARPGHGGLARSAFVTALKG
ncbi:helix-turn-helix transcriptional regulator [Streptomyces sp. NPDC002057]|uniref:helix-turn-helix domain-containing protein n=1 Tax=Streptomyces sp. NPDC002057 TaxID=3154664 RepID=UPI003334037F